jgi:hypothetical protein
MNNKTIAIYSLVMWLVIVLQAIIISIKPSFFGFLCMGFGIGLWLSSFLNFFIFIKQLNKVGV